MEGVLGSLYVSKKNETLLTKKDLLKVMRITGRMMFELENYYFEECCFMVPYNENYTDAVFDAPGVAFCEYFCELALYNRVDGDIIDYNESIEIQNLADKVLVHIILTGKNTTGYSRIIGA